MFVPHLLSPDDADEVLDGEAVGFQEEEEAVAVLGGDLVGGGEAAMTGWPAQPHVHLHHCAVQSSPVRRYSPPAA